MSTARNKTLPTSTEKLWFLISVLFRLIFARKNSKQRSLISIKHLSALQNIYQSCNKTNNQALSKKEMKANIGSSGKLF